MWCFYILQVKSIDRKTSFITGIELLTNSIIYSIQCFDIEVIF